MHKRLTKYSKVTMVKISDLSVGDWITLEGADLKIEHGDIATAFVEKARKPIRVQSILGEDKLVFAHIEHFEGYGTIYSKEEHLRPIPITPEILEANGWRNDGMYAILRIDEHLHLEYYYHEHRLRKWYCGVDEWENHAKVNDITFQAHCYSIHQLQHALRLAGVDKEIVMPNK